jgi:hypothetical protein
MSTYKLKQLNVMSVAKIGAVLGLIWGLIWGIVMAIWVSSLGFIMKSLLPMAGLGAGLIFVFAIIFGLIGGFIAGAFWAFVYNVVAGFVGPIEMDLEV